MPDVKSGRVLGHPRSRTSNTGMKLGVMACAMGALLAAASVAHAKGGTAKPPPAPPPTPGSCPNGTSALVPCIVPPAGPVLPDFPPTAANPLSGNLSNGFSIIGYVQNVTGPACPAAGTPAVANPAGGSVTVNDIVITIPSDTIVQYPANTLTWADAICGTTYIGLDATGGPAAVAGVAAPVVSPGVEIRIEGNIVASGGVAANGASPHIASLVHLSQQSVNSGSGYITAINYATGVMSVGTQTGAVNLMLNDPKGRYGTPQSSPDARFSVDDANPTIKAAASGYPMCVPRSAPNGGGAAFTVVGGIPQDPLCPQKNRPNVAPCRNFRASGVAFRIAGADLATTLAPNGFCSAFVMPAIAGMPGSVAAAGSTVLDGTGSTGAAPDPRQQVPFEVGDFITWQGTLSGTGPTAIIWVHTIDANVGAYTQPATLPSYIAIGNMSIGVDPLSSAAPALPGAEATPRLVLEANTTDVSSIVDVYLDDKGFSLPAGTPNGPIVPDVIGAPANEYFRWMTPESMTGTLASQAVQPAGLVPANLIFQANAFGGGIYTQFIGPQPGRARIRAIKVPAVDTLAGPCPVSATTIGGGQGCAVTASPTRYIRAVTRSLCAPAATLAASSRGGFPAVPATNLDTGVAGAVANSGPYFDINLTRANLPGAGPGTSSVAHLIGPTACLESAQFANGLFTGQYMAPVGEFIFPENTLAGAPILPNNFYHLGFLAYGENGKDGNSTRPQAPRPW